MKTYTVEEIEGMLEKPDGEYCMAGECRNAIRQLLAERTQIRKQAFEEAATIADTMRRNGYIFIGDELRREAEQEIGNGDKSNDKRCVLEKVGEYKESFEPFFGW